MLGTSIFSISYNVFFPSQIKFQFLIEVYFVVCKSFKFGTGLIFHRVIKGMLNLNKFNILSSSSQTFCGLTKSHAIIDNNHKIYSVSWRMSTRNQYILVIMCHLSLFQSNFYMQVLCHSMPADKILDWSQIERNCMTTFHSAFKIENKYHIGKKTLWEKEKLLVTSNVSFSHVFHSYISLVRQNEVLCGNGLTLSLQNR